MRKYSILFALILFLLSHAKITAQTSESDYLKTEQKRIEQAEKIELEISKFIENNIDSYDLTNILEERIRNSKSCSDKKSFGKQVITSNSENKLSSQIDNAKREELRKLYFKEHPEALTYYEATPLPRFIECTNGGFENGIASYSFETMDLDHDENGPGTGWNGINTIMTGTPITTVGLDQFTNANVSLVTSGFEPLLAGIGINIPRTLNGNRAIKLNRTQRFINANYEVTTMTRQLTINDNFLDINFSLIMENPGHPNPNFFRIRVLNSQGAMVDQVFIESNPANCLFQSTGTALQTLLYTGWVCARLNVGQILNQQGTIEFMIADCGQAGHFSTVYIDDICGVESNCTNPQFGSINLNPRNSQCPAFPEQICGTYQLPPNSTLGNISLNILQNNVVVGTINTTSQLTASTFCFSVDSSNFPSLTGIYEFRVNATFVIDCPANDFNWDVSDTSTNVGPDVNFDFSDTVQNIQLDQPTLTYTWNNTATSYIFEAVFDDSCTGAISNTNVFFSTILNTNSLYILSNDFLGQGGDLWEVVETRIFRFRIRPNTPCGTWSEWCCYPQFDINNNCNPPNQLPCIGGFNQVISQNVSNGQTLIIDNVENNITSYNIIESNTNVNYFAGSSIILTSNSSSNQNQHVKSGSVFQAKIEVCSTSQKMAISENNNSNVFVNNSEREINLIEKQKVDSYLNDFITIYPNPTTKEINISSEKNNILNIELINGFSYIIRSNENINGKDIKIDVSNLNKGIYYLKITMENEDTFVKKIIIN